MPVHFRRVPDRADDLEHTIGVFVADVEHQGEEIAHIERFGDHLAVFTRRTPKAAPAARKAVSK